MKRLYFIIAAMLLATAASAQNSNNVPDGLDAVDLALPSGTLWANMNVGATTPEGYGDYFAWGETSVQSSYRYFWDSYKWCNGSYKALSKYCSDASFGHNGFTDNMTVLEADDDAATAIWGSGWRMPTSAEMEELVSNTTGRWTTLNGVYGRKFTSNINGHSIFLPAAGCWYDSKSHGAGSYGAYWSNSINAESPSNAWSFNFGIAYVGKSYFNRLSGFTIRPVSTVRLGVSSSSLTFASSAGSEQVTITCNGNWTATSSELWCTVSPASGTGNGVLTITASENSSADSRSATVTVTANALMRTVTVTQNPMGIAVDLGLPSGTLWANMNVGAEQPEDYGDYFAWGETTGYGADTNDGHSFDWSTYKWCEGSGSTLTKYCYNSSSGYNGFTDNKRELDLEDDAAYVNWGAAWRMPSVSQLNELRTNCTWTWTTKGTVNGYEVTGANGNSIFLPAAGYRYDSSLNYVGSFGNYWSRTLNEGGPYHAWGLRFYSSDIFTYGDYRCHGRSVRPVWLSEASLELSSSSLTFASTAGSEQVTITCNDSWTATSNESWCTVSPTSGTGDGVLTITASENTSTNSRSATVTVTAGSLTRTVTVTQNGKTSGGTTPAGVEAVDLGLPSGTLWANMNVGAEQPEDYGDYFAWCETEGYNSGKTIFDWSTYKWCEGSWDTMTKYCNDSSHGYNGFFDNKTELDLEDDAAYVNWGAAWRMPSMEQIDELRTNCTWTWTTKGSVNGYEVTGANGNSLFLPAAGYRYTSSLSRVGSRGDYWSRTLYEGDSSYAWSLDFGSSDIDTDSGYYRCYGQSVRPVRLSEASLELSSSSLSLTSSAGSGQVTITSNGSWTATSSEPWCTVSPTSGTGDAVLTITASENTSSSSRSATVTVTAGAYLWTIIVTQKGKYSGGTAPAGVEAVDLGLPSGTLWANMNVGAEQPEDYGDYFAWGETEGYNSGKTIFDWSTYKWYYTSYNVSGHLTKYCDDGSVGYNGFTDDKTMLDLEDDAAYVNWGSAWCMPTKEQFEELINSSYTTTTWTTQNNVYGRLITSKSNGNSVFLPAAGYRDDYSLRIAGSEGEYWSRTLSEGGPYLAWILACNSGFIGTNSSVSRWNGLSVRPVRLSEASLELSSLSLSLASSAGSGQVTIISNGSWTATSNEPWCTVSPASGTGDGVLTITATENTSTDSRSAIVTVTASALTRTVTVTQNGKSSGGTTPAGVEAVDLGLPSGTLWANMNVGAEQPEDYGDYFAWGETTGYGADTNDGHSFYWSTYKWCEGSETTMTKYCNDSSYGYNGYTDNKTELDPEDDAAYVNWGPAWRMPSKEQFAELINSDYTTTTWTTQNGVYGRLITSKKEGYTGNSVFLPAAGFRYTSSLVSAGSEGHYRSRTLYERYPNNAWDFDSGFIDMVGGYRYLGLSVRPVRASE